MGGCDITTNPIPHFQELEQWQPANDIPLKLLKNTSIWPKFNNTLNYELIRIDSFQKPVEWHIVQLSNCLAYFSKELENVVKEREKEELEKLRNIFESRRKYLQKNQKIVDYLIQKGFKITNFGFTLEKVNLKNIWAELFPIGYYFRFEEEDQPFNDDDCLKLLPSLDLNHSVKEKLGFLLEKNLPFNHATQTIYNLLLQYYSIPLVEILERSAVLYHIHNACTTLLSTSAPSTPIRPSGTTSIDLTHIPSDNNADNNEALLSYHLHLNGTSHNFSSSLNLNCPINGNNFICNGANMDSDSNGDDDDITSDDSETISEFDIENNNSFYFFTDKQLELLRELKEHSLNKSSYLLRIKRSIRMEHKRNFNLPGERRKKSSENQTDIHPHLSLLCLTNNLHIGESIDSLDPGNRCIYRKCYHLYKSSIDSELLHSLSRPVDQSSGKNIEKIFHSTPPSPVTISPSPSSNGIHLPSSSSSPSNVISPSPLSSSIYSSSEPFKHIPFFIWLEGKDLDGVKKEKFYHWDLIPSLSMKITFHNSFAHHPLCSLRTLHHVNNNNNNFQLNYIINEDTISEEEKVIDGVYIYAIDENDDLYVLPKVPEDEKERNELDLTALNIVKKIYPDYFLFPNHPRLIHSANGRSLGEITFVNGKITKISNVSGHYRPHGYQFYLAVIALCKNGEIFNDDAQVMYRHSTGTDVFSHSQFVKLNRKEMLLDVIKGKDRPTGLLYHVKCNCD